jgi:hypothetical protein
MSDTGKTASAAGLTEGGIWADDTGDVGFIGERISGTPPEGPVIIGGVQIDRKDSQRLLEIIPKELIVPLTKMIMREMLAIDHINAPGIKKAIELVTSDAVNLGLKNADSRHTGSIQALSSEFKALSHRATGLEAKVDSLSKVLTERSGPELELFRSAKEVVEEHTKAVRANVGEDAADTIAILQKQAADYSAEIATLQAQLRSAQAVSPVSSRPVNSAPKGKGRKPAWVKE